MLDGYNIIDEFTCIDVGLVWSDLTDIEPDPDIVDEMIERTAKTFESE